MSPWRCEQAVDGLEGQFTFPGSCRSQLGQPVTATRRRVMVDRELPLGDGYGAFLGALLESVSG